MLWKHFYIGPGRFLMERGLGLNLQSGNYVMREYYHTFHIPVMGLGYSADTPIRVAHLGITSAISITDDIMLEPMRKHYCEKFGLPFSEIPKNESDGRAKRITAYLDAVQKIVRINTQSLRRQPFFKNNDKRRYFELLPDESPMKREYNRFLDMSEGPERDVLAESLTSGIIPGSIDVNIMVKLDSMNSDSGGNPLGDEFSDAKAALRGYANSNLDSAIVLSAGFNKSLFSYMSRFQDFYPDESGDIRKRIILKVSDFRSSLIQGRVLAKKGLEVWEFRIESGLNCGGHAFPTNGHLLPGILREFNENRDRLGTEFQKLIQKYYKAKDMAYPDTALSRRPLITVQGGVGNNGENRRLMEYFGMDLTGWGSPFLLVPETTCVDETTRELLRQAGEKELYLSDASPFGIPFNNVRNSGSDIRTRELAAKGRTGYPCSKGFLVSNTEFSEKKICLGSRQYQMKKLEKIDGSECSESEKGKLRRKVTEKACLCEHLSNSALIALGLAKEDESPQAICPGPNIAWFDRYYTLEEMVDHIYGRGPDLLSSERPHMFANEIVMYVDYFEKQIENCSCSPKEISRLHEYKDNLEQGMDFCLNLAEARAYPGENLASISDCVKKQRARLRSLQHDFEEKVSIGKLEPEPAGRS